MAAVAWHRELVFRLPDADARSSGRPAVRRRRRSARQSRPAPRLAGGARAAYLGVRRIAHDDDAAGKTTRAHRVLDLKELRLASIRLDRPRVSVGCHDPRPFGARHGLRAYFQRRADPRPSGPRVALEALACRGRQTSLYLPPPQRPSSSGPGRRPFTAETRVRFP